MGLEHDMSPTDAITTGRGTSMVVVVGIVSVDVQEESATIARRAAIRRFIVFSFCT
jgi:hypothetical protein